MTAQIEREVTIVMVYTGWTQRISEAAIEQWRVGIRDWNAEYILQYLSVEEKEKVAQLCGEER